MSINRENYSISQTYSDSTSLPSFYHSIPSINCIRFNPQTFRTPINTHLSLSKKNDSFSPEGFSARYSRPSMLNERMKEPISSKRLSRRMKDKLQRKIYEESFSPLKGVNWPFALEPQSSSSQPSEIFSGSRKESSPLKPPEDSVGKEETPIDVIFTEERYQRANDFLDSEGLQLADPLEYVRNLSHFSKTKITKSNFGDQENQFEELYDERMVVKSANHSPQLISDRIWGSSLFQRRSSRSQGPKDPNNSPSPLNKTRPSRLIVFKHFKDDLNQIMQTASPIEEKDTPVISRPNSCFQECTPERIGPKRFNLRPQPSPGSAETKTPEQAGPRNILTKYTFKPSKSIKSPHLKLEPMSNVVEISFVTKSQEENQSSSQCSSPIKVDPEDSPKSTIQIKDDQKPKSGIVIKKSRFQKLKELQELPSME